MGVQAIAQTMVCPDPNSCRGAPSGFRRLARQAGQLNDEPEGAKRWAFRRTCPIARLPFVRLDQEPRTNRWLDLSKRPSR